MRRTTRARLNHGCRWPTGQARGLALYSHLKVKVQPRERPELLFSQQRSFLALAVYRGDQPRRVEGDTTPWRRLGTQALLGEQRGRRRLVIVAHGLSSGDVFCTPTS